jgi:hypothetical protein
VWLKKSAALSRTQKHRRFHSANALIAMIYLCCAGIQIPLPHR